MVQLLAPSLVQAASPASLALTPIQALLLMLVHSLSKTGALPIWSLRQRDFHYDQVMFMNAMRKRWHWFLIADDSFPTNTNTGLLEIVKEGYGVNPDTTEKLNELISQSKYIYVEYEVEVLYTLQSIKAGDTSQRLGTRKGKPLHFTEKKYSGPYRSFVTKLQQYS
ncbi:hypothetical protein FRC11_005541 [Ceratobasidium sp. 423]|nr:hypothetical protein FRC11_005541 [Ceratobasidium sp. 423]